MKLKTVLGILALSAAIPATSWAGWGDALKAKAKGAKDAATCNDDKGVEQAGKDMDEKAYNALISTEKALVSVAEAAKKPEIAKKAKANLEKWANKEKAPSGLDRVKEINSASESIQKGSKLVEGEKLDAAGQKSMVEARSELRMAVIYVAWGAKIGEPIPGKAKDAIAADKACSAKVKGPADAAAGLTSLSTKIKSTYTAVSDAAKKTGAPEMTEADKKAQDGQIGAPDGVAGV